jgi:hypothetical protein
MALFSCGCCIVKHLDEDNISAADRLAIDRTNAIALMPRLGSA